MLSLLLGEKLSISTKIFPLHVSDLWYNYDYRDIK